jgi:hypothetical protein
MAFEEGRVHSGTLEGEAPLGLGESAETKCGKPEPPPLRLARG